MKTNTEKYVDYIMEKTTEVLAIDSPTGYTRNAAEYVVKEYEKLGYKPVMTVIMFRFQLLQKEVC